jgi:hypothetical protein
VTSCSRKPQDISNADLFKYKQVYDYIIKDSISLNKKIMVSDTIVFMERTLFWENLKVQGEKAEITINRIDSIDNARKYDNFYSLQLSKSFKKDTTATLNLYFSKIFKDSLVAEVIDNKGLYKASYNRVTMFNTGYCYLFTFDTNGTIKEVLIKEISYN